MTPASTSPLPAFAMAAFPERFTKGCSPCLHTQVLASFNTQVTRFSPVNCDRISILSLWSSSTVRRTILDISFMWGVKTKFSWGSLSR